MAKPGCRTDENPFAGNLQNAAKAYTSSSSLASFARYFCNQYHPADGGLCFVRNCLIVGPQEHSISESCFDDHKVDLTNQRLIPDQCIVFDSNGDTPGTSFPYLDSSLMERTASAPSAQALFSSATTTSPSAADRGKCANNKLHHRRRSRPRRQALSQGRPRLDHGILKVVLGISPVY